MSTVAPVSLQRRLTLVALGGLIVALTTGAWWLSKSFAKAVERGFDERLETVLQTLVAETEPTIDGSVVLGRQIGDPRFEQIYSGSYWQISNADGILLRSRSLWDQEIPFTVSTPDGSTLFHYWTNPAGQHIRLAERDLTLPGHPDVLHFIVAGRTTEIEAELRRFDQLLMLGIAGLIALLGLTIALQVRIGLGPVRTLLDDLEAVRQGRRSRVDEGLPSELKPLAATINQLLDHGDRIVVRARDQAADLAHAIKTPLAVLRADADALDLPIAVGMRERLDLIDGLVRRNLARSTPVRTDVVNALGTQVAPVVQQMVALMHRVHPDRQIAETLVVPEGMHVRIDREDLEEVLGNLLDNAWKWARTCVRVTAVVDGARCCLKVEDDGPGLTHDSRPLAMGRRVRLDERSSGQGLGLPIARDIVESAHGTLDLGVSAEGGLAVILELPLAQPGQRG